MENIPTMCFCANNSLWRTTWVHHNTWRERHRDRDRQLRLGMVHRSVMGNDMHEVSMRSIK